MKNTNINNTAQFSPLAANSNTKDSSQKRALSFYLKTFGCQMNEADSDLICLLMKRSGYYRADSVSEADIIIFNTCSVREHAENRALTNLFSLKIFKKKKPETVIIFAGCAAHRLKAELVKKAPYTDIIMGTRNIFDLPKLIIQSQQNKKEGSIVAVDEKPPEDDRCGFIDGEKSGFQAFVPISIGCNNYCSYCIVPYVRGSESSRSDKNIIEEISKLAITGYIEVTLLGQNVNSYNYREAGKNIDFSDLMNLVENIDGIKRIRFMTSHPKDFNEKLIKTIAGSSKACEHLHLPLQSGSDSILKSMNRGYTKEDYIGLVQKIRASIPDASISTDIIVGYPGETHEDFNETLSMVKTIEFDSAYTFKYSPRPGTAAAKLEDSVPTAVKEERLKTLAQYVSESSLSRNRRMLDKEEEALVGAYNEKNKTLIGRTRNSKQVFFEGNKELIGKFVKLRITHAYAWSLRGKIA